MQQYVNHFSYRHPLELSEVHEEEEKEAICSGCELEITGGSAYTCTKPKCTFILHNSCFELPRLVRHKSHPKHPLSLHFSPPYSDREFRCDACGNSGHRFTFHCKTCKFDLHVECASLPEMEHREDHEHPLSLLYSSTPLVEGGDFVCFACKCSVANGSWVYCCLACNCGTHLHCV